MSLKSKIKSLEIDLSVYWQDFLIKASANSNRPLNKPTSIIINLTPNCILKCRQCDIWRNPPEKHLTLKEGKIIIDKLYSWLGSCYIFFTGGEPLMNNDLPEIIGYAYSKGIISHINSNASLIDKDLAKKLTDNHLFAISISLDGATPKTHDYLRGVPGTFNKVKNAIKYLQSSSHPPKIYINTVIMKNNVHELQKLIDLTGKFKANGISFQCLLPNLGKLSIQKTLINNPLWPDKKVVASELKKIIKNIKNNPLILSTEQDFLTDINYYNNPSLVRHGTCAAGINNFIIDYHGDVKICFKYPNVGNILKENPKDIWLGQTSQTQRAMIRKCQENCKIIVCNKTDTRRNKTAAYNLLNPSE